MKREIYEKALALLPLLPHEPPDTYIEHGKKCGAFTNNLIYSAVKGDKSRVRAYCTACKKESFPARVDFEKKKTMNCYYHDSQDVFGFYDADNHTVKSFEPCICPLCGAACEAIKTTKFKYYPRKSDSQLIYSAHNIDGSFALLVWCCERFIDKTGSESYETHRWEGILIIDGQAVRITGHTLCFTSGGYYPDWQVRRNFTDKILDINTARYIQPEGHPEYGTSAENSGFTEYVNANKDRDVYPFTYLYQWTIHKQLENLSKSGAGALLNDILGECYKSVSYYKSRMSYSQLKDYLDFKKRKPHELLGLTKDEYKADYIKSDIECLMIYINIKKLYGQKLGKKALTAGKALGRRSFITLSELLIKLYGLRINIEKMAEYLNSQGKKAEKRNVIISPDYYKDYINAVHTVNREIPQSLIYPKDLIYAHDDFTARLKIIIDEKKEKSISERAEAFAYMEYKDDGLGLFIRPARSGKELIEEGKALSHCVGRYADDVAQGKTLILFIRHTDKPDESYFTLECKNNKVIQNRGKCNCERTPDVKEFESKWLSYLAAAEIKDKKTKEKKNGKRIGNPENGAAVA